jgi:hypothetical protein
VCAASRRAEVRLWLCLPMWKSPSSQAVSPEAVACQPQPKRRYRGGAPAPAVSNKVGWCMGVSECAANYAGDQREQRQIETRVMRRRRRQFGKAVAEVS